MKIRAPPTRRDPDRDLRAELEAAIEVQRDADAAADRAAGISEIANKLLDEARERLVRLQGEQREAERLNIERRARSIELALRSGSDLPAAPVPEPADTAALAAAMAAHDAIEIAAGKLAAEHDSARADAAAAAQAVHGIVYEIVTAEAAELAQELIATTERGWKLFDKLAGLVRIDERRADPVLRALQDYVMERIDRRKAAVAKNPLYIERHNYGQYIDDFAAAQERAWQAYGQRLAADAGATFDGEESGK